MTILFGIMDGVKGERIVCEFRKMTRPQLIAKTHAHKAQRIKIIGFPAEAYIEKPIKLRRK